MTVVSGIESECTKAPATPGRSVSVFVLLGRGFGAARWRERHARGDIAGLNEPLPYGYDQAAGDGWSVVYSEDTDEGSVARMFRRSLTWAAGFDLIHAWRNRKQLFAADVVWAHTEREHLAALLLRCLRPHKRNPKIIAECMWLPDRWSSIPRAKRALYRWLLARADALTSQSEEGVSWLRKQLPQATIEHIPSGAIAEFMRLPRRVPIHRPTRIAALGTDMHRDWPTLFAALGGNPSFELRVASSNARGRRRDSEGNVTVTAASTEADVRSLYDWADMIVVPLKPNRHVSGRTVIFEAVALAVPIIATDVGGLRVYFSDDELCFVPSGDPRALEAAATRLADDDNARFNMAVAAQRRVLVAGLTTRAYAEGHRNLSRALLAERRDCQSGSAVHDERGSSEPTATKCARVFVLLGYGFGAARWCARHARAEIPGLNDMLPYGYHRAAGEGCSIRYSEDADESLPTRFVRRALTRILGFDLIHAWRNRRPLLSSDVVWTHTERENLAVFGLFRLLGPRERPKVVAQCIWLFDRWHNFSRPRRALYRRLLSRADVVTTHSRSNLAVARKVLPATRSELLSFGWTSIDQMKPPRSRPLHPPTRLGSLGGDMHRDWNTLLSAFAGKPTFELMVASTKERIPMASGIDNVRIRAARSEAEVKDLYDWADIVVVTLAENRHASGITVILEAVASGIPVVVTDTGGLRDYFSDGEVCYVPVGNSQALREAVQQLAIDSVRRATMTAAAQRRLIEADLTSEGFALRHRALTDELLGRRPSTTRVDIHSSPTPQIPAPTTASGQLPRINRASVRNE